jgi:hypothetical protein
VAKKNVGLGTLTRRSHAGAGPAGVVLPTAARASTTVVMAQTRTRRRVRPPMFRGGRRRWRGRASRGPRARRHPRRRQARGQRAFSQGREGLTAAPAHVGARPVIRRGRFAVPVPPGAHRLPHALACPLRRDRAGVAALAVAVGVALAVARLGGGAAAAAHPLVAGLDRLGLLAGGVIEVRLDGGWGRRDRLSGSTGRVLKRESVDPSSGGDRPSQPEPRCCRL